MINWGPQIDTLKFIQSNAYSSTVINKFSGSFTYPGPGIYNIIYDESFRIGGLKNIINSQLEKVIVTTTLNINPFVVGNIAPTLQNYPIYFGKNGNQAFFDPNFFDSNGDSLSYSITNCYASNYYLPSGVAINPYGVLSFSKDSIGSYAFSYNINEWRKDLDGNYFNVGASQIDFVMDISSSIGIKEINKQNTIKVFPNPATTFVNIYSDLNFDSSSRIEITNTLGQTVLKLNYTTEIDVSQLAQGYYTLKIIATDKQQYHSKFIKND